MRALIRLNDAGDDAGTPRFGALSSPSIANVFPTPGAVPRQTVSRPRLQAWASAWVQTVFRTGWGISRPARASTDSTRSPHWRARRRAINRWENLASRGAPHGSPSDGRTHHPTVRWCLSLTRLESHTSTAKPRSTSSADLPPRIPQSVIGGSWRTIVMSSAGTPASTKLRTIAL